MGKILNFVIGAIVVIFVAAVFAGIFFLQSYRWGGCS